MNAPDFEVGEGGNRLAGWRSGEGPPVVLLHGGPGLSDYMDSLASELVDGYDVVRYQQRGLTPSTTAGPFDVETQLADVLAVLDRLTLERPLIVGHSWGGHLAMHLIAAHPERVSGALIIDPLGAVPDGGEAALGPNLHERMTAEAAVRAAELDQRAMRGEGTDADLIEGLALLWPGYFADPPSAPPMPADLRMSVVAYSETFASIHQHFERETLVTLLPRSQVPALFVMGEGSPIPYSYGVESAALLPHGQSRVLPGCGHIPWLEQPGLIRSHLDDLRARSASVSA